MKKTLLLLASAALLLVGCAKEQLSNGLEGELTKVTFTASLDSGVATKAVADGDGAAASVNRCIMEIYYGDALFTRQITKVTDKKATFTVQVVSNRTYTVAFWADKVDNLEDLATDKYYITNAEGGLQAITINGSYLGNDDARDAFFHVGNYTVAQAGSSFGSGEEDKILLKRPFAQMNVITTDWDKAASVTGLAPEKVNVTLKNALVKFNAVTGVASGSQDLEYEASVYAPAANGAEKTLSMDYLFASDTKALIDIDWKAKKTGDADVEHAFAAVPYQRNYRTNIKGALLTTQGQWTVTVDPDWGDPDYTHPVVIATTLAEARAAVGPTSTGTEAAGTVIVKPEAIANRTADDEKEKSYVEAKTTDITLPDGAKAIEFVLTPQSKTDVTFELPALPPDTDTEKFYWYIRHEENYPTKNLNVKVSEGEETRVIIDAPNNTHVVLNDVEYTHVIAITGDNTLVVPAGITVDKLTVKKGGVEIHGTVTELEIIGTEDEVFFRSCEGLSEDVFKKIYSETAPVCNYIDPWYTYEKVGNVYNIKKLPIVATIGEENYKSLEEAIAAVEDGQTIKIVDNVPTAGGISVPSGKNFTVDFGGHTYAMECPGAGSAGTKTAGFQLLKNSTIVFKNGKIECTEANKDKTWSSGDASKGIALMIQNYANLTLEDMTIDATNIAHNGVAVRYALSNNSGNVEYKGATSIITVAGDYAFDVCKYDTYDAPTVTWNSTGDVTGIIELSGGNFVVAKDLKVTTPIRANSGASTMTINEGVVVSPVDAGFRDDVKTKYAETSKETQKGVVVVNRGGDLKITGQGTIDAKGKCYAAVTLTEKGEAETGEVAKLTVLGSSSTASKYIKLQGGQYYAICGNGGRGNTDVTVKYAQLDAPGFCIYQPQQGNLTIGSGTFNGYSCVGVKSGNITISGGTFNASGAAKDYVANNSGIEETGQALIIDNCDYPGGSPVVNITGGTFTSAHNTAIGNYYGVSQTAAITKFIHGGTYSSPAEEAWVGDDMYWEKLSDGMYSYGQYVGTSNNSTSKAGTYKLLKDYTISQGRIQIGSIGTKNTNIIFDLGGHTLTKNSSASYAAIFCNANIGVNNVITIKNGTMDVQCGNIAIQVTKNSTFNLESDLTINTAVGGALVGGTGVLNCAATINNTGNCVAIQTNGSESTESVVNITGGTITSPDVAVYHPAGTLYISGGSISGTTGVYIKSGTTTISGGTITGNGEKKAYQFNGNGCCATGDALVVDNCGYPSGAPSVTLTNTVTAGTLFSANANQIGNYYGNGQTEAATITNNSGVDFSTRTNE